MIKIIPQIFILIALIVIVIFTLQQASSKTKHASTLFVTGITCDPNNKTQACQRSKCDNPSVLNYHSSSPHVNLPFAPIIKDDKLCITYVLVGTCGKRIQGSIAINYTCP